MAGVISLSAGDGFKQACPSGLQTESPLDKDPLARHTELAPFIRQKDENAEIDLIVQGARCGGCVAKIEQAFRDLKGVKAAHMNLTTLRLNIVWTADQVEASRFIPLLNNLGYNAAPFEISDLQRQTQARQTSLLRAMAVAGFAAMNVMLMSIAVWVSGSDMQPATLSLFHWMSLVIALPTVIYAGQVFFRSAWQALSKGQTNMDVPISLALILACALSIYETLHHNPDTYFDAAVMLLFLLLIGRYLDARLRRQTGEAAEKLIALQAHSATRILDDGRMETVVTRLVRPGDILLIPAGQSIPVDGEIIEGRSELDLQIATGETQPCLKQPGDHIYSGTVNLTTPLKIRALAHEQDSFLSEITRLVETGAQTKTRFVKIADRAARAYVPVVHSLAVLTFLGWLLAGADLRPAILSAIAVLIITCPCALGLAVPAVQIVASGRLFQKGVLLKSGDALERLARTNHVIFDKTGTLTTGKFNLVNSSQISEEDLRLAVSLARYSRHPLAKALAGIDIAPMDLDHVNEQAGQGISAKFQGNDVSFGAARNSESHKTRYTESHLIKGTNPPVSFLFEDRLRQSSGPALRDLHKMNIPAELLSGDKPVIAQAIGKELQLSRAVGGVSPAGKIARLNQLKDQYTLMVGDGINDAPALAHAYVSASLAEGSDISRAAADIIIQNDDLQMVPEAIKIAKKADRRVKENLGFTIIYNLCAIPLAVLGLVNPLIAALAMSGSSMVVTLNALRMRRT